MSFTKNKRDANEAALVARWKQLGCVWIPQPRENGFDGLLARNGERWIVEVKDGSKSPSDRKLTKNEIATRARLQAVGVEYHIIETEEQAIALVLLPFE